MSEEIGKYETRPLRQKYQLVECDHRLKLEERVNELLSENWLLHGATQIVADSTNSGSFWFYQAMIRYQVDDEDDHRISQAALGEIATAMTRLSDSARVG